MVALAPTRTLTMENTHRIPPSTRERAYLFIARPRSLLGFSLIARAMIIKSRLQRPTPGGSVGTSLLRRRVGGVRAPREARMLEARSDRYVELG
jgi:hypothetical protein